MTIDYAELRRLAEVVGPGEWFWDSWCSKHSGQHLQIPSGGSSVIAGVGAYPLADYIAAASPETILALLDRIEELERENAELRQGEELSEALTGGLSKLLDGAIVALRGPHPPNGLWGVADVSERIRALQAELAAAKGGER